MHKISSSFFISSICGCSLSLRCCNNSSTYENVGEDKYYLLPGSYINKETNVICEVKTLTIKEFWHKNGINVYYDVNIKAFYELIFSYSEDSPFSDFYFSNLKKVGEPHAPTWYKDDNMNELYAEYPNTKNNYFFTIYIYNNCENEEYYHFEKNIN